MELIIRSFRPQAKTKLSVDSNPKIGISASRGLRGEYPQQFTGSGCGRFAGKPPNNLTYELRGSTVPAGGLGAETSLQHPHPRERHNALRTLSSPCPRSVHMRRRGLIGSASFEVTGRGLSGKSAVGSVVVVEMLEAVEDGIEGLD